MAGDTSASQQVGEMGTGAGDPLALGPLFAGGGEPWLAALKPTLEGLPGAAAFIGPGRSTRIVPVRELTFQALKPNPPHRWKVVVFGQNPYPRVESATGIAMFDNTFHDWRDGQFGRVTSIRCIIKAACIWKHRIAKQTSIAEIRGLLARQDVVPPPGWFQAMLTQGVLLLNTALTASSDGALPTDRHTAFWRPVVERVVEEILAAKQGAAEGCRGVVFAWWGSHARALRPVVERLQRKYPGVSVRHLDHCNPAAQGDMFCDGDHFADVNAALRALNLGEVDWLPSAGWARAGQADAGRMGDFISQTMELHKFYLERLQEVKEEGGAELPPLTGVLGRPVPGFAEAAEPLLPLLSGLGGVARQSSDFARRKAGRAAAGLSEHEVAALHLYTTASAFYRELNAALRHPDRGRVAPYCPYLRLFFSAVAKLEGYRGSLWRGVALDLRAQYPRGATVTWWGVSSCTSKLSVAQAFLGSRGRRTLFEVAPLQAVGIRQFSAFTGEEEFLLPPGTRLRVADVRSERSGLCTVKLEELAQARLVA
jgi:uracil DNA glycosylase